MTGSARLVLLVRCAACGHEFDTGIRMDRRNFARATFASNYHRCSHCGCQGTYHKEEYLPRDAPPHGRDAIRRDRDVASRDESRPDQT